MEWKNTPDLYTDYIQLEEAPQKMLQLLTKYPFFFDEEFFYWQVKDRKGNLRPIIKRRPLYWYPQKSTPAEKHRKMIWGKQLTLSEMSEGPGKSEGRSEPDRSKPERQQFSRENLDLSRERSPERVLDLSKSEANGANVI